MPAFNYFPPKKFGRSTYGCNIPSENFRLKSLLMLIGIGGIGRSNAASPSKLNTDFLVLPYQTPTGKGIDHILSKFENCSRSQLDDFFRKAITKNYALHKNIYHELKNTLGYIGENNQIGCYLHLYRVIEQCALYLPIVSIINKGIFNNTFSEFKNLIDGNAKRDLSVLNKYSKQHLNSTIANSVARFSFSRTSRPLQNIAVIKRFVKADSIVSEAPDYIEIKYKDIDSLIVGFRNQYFHYLFHETNLSITDIECPDEFLEVCNPIFINYFSFLFLELLESELAIWGN